MFMKKDMPKSMKMKLKGGGFVDPDSNLEHKVIDNRCDEGHF